MTEIAGGAGEARTPDLRFRKTPNLFDLVLKILDPTIYTLTREAP
jgi:hypothetical protein